MKTKKLFRNFIEVYIKGGNLPSNYLQKLKMDAVMQKDYQLAASIRYFQIKFTK